MSRLVLPQPGRAAAEGFVASHFGSVTEDGVDGPVEGSLRYFGGVQPGREVLASFDVAGYAARSNEVSPQRRRAASGLSPYLRHGLLGLEEVWHHVASGPPVDVEAFREQLLWNEYARHWYSRVGTSSAIALQRELPPPAEPTGWIRDMACLEMTVEELEEEGWTVGRARSWLASYWGTNGGSWPDGEDFLFRHLLDGSRASNRLGWQQSLGLNGAKPFHFNRWQVEKWAAGLCASCDLVRNCPIEAPATGHDYQNKEVPLDAVVATDLLLSAGPPTPDRFRVPRSVWLTAESLGPMDPALVANPGLGVVFVFDRPLLARLRLSAKRLVFLVETLVELAQHREVEVWFDDPIDILAGRDVAVTFAPVPGFRTRATRIQPAEIHPWQWMLEPTTGSVASFRDWRRSVDAASPLSGLSLSRSAV